MSATDTLLWPFRQLAAVPRRLWSQASSVDFRRYGWFLFVQPIINTIKFTRLMVFWTLGRGSAFQMMAGSVVLAIQLIVASFTLLTYAAVIFIPPFLLGAARLIPWVDRQWRSLTGVGSGSYDQLNSLDFWPGG